MTRSLPSGLPPELASEVRAWIAADPDPETRGELESLLAAGDAAALFERFAEPLSFGTAGLRGPLGAGPARMNRLVVRRTTAGVARWVLAKGAEAAAAGLVVGRDARHGSAAFAADVVEVASAMGVNVRVLPQPLPTPLTAFAVLHYRAAAGVMVTASHNPAPDNGYKVYASDGAQIVPPDDGLIAAAAGLAGTLGTPDWVGDGAGLVTAVDRQELLEAYAGAVLGVLRPGGPRQLRVVYTPVHGVGGVVLPWLMERAGFAAPQLVAAQSEPDPDFPTAPFPNPEEPGVLDLALAEAARCGADLLIANDPDADRLAVAVPPGAGAPSADAGDWRVLSGDELGALLGDELIRRSAQRAAAEALHAGGIEPGAAPVEPGAAPIGPGAAEGVPVVSTSIVSSTLLGEIAGASGIRFVETLTGFKWIARAADEVPGGRLLFGYEEALGYAVSPAVRDKDGLSAALLVAELAAAARAAGRTLIAALDELDRRFGVHRSSQWSLRLEGPDAQRRLVAIVEDWRERSPDQLAGMPVREVVDLERGLDGLPPTPGLLLRLGGIARDGSIDRPVGGATAETRPGDEATAASPDTLLHGRVVVRPSGTESKLKAYLEVVGPPLAGVGVGVGVGGGVGGGGGEAWPGALADARHAARAAMERLRAEVAAALSASS